MNNLMIFENKEIEGVKLSNQNGQVVVSSRLIAKDFEKQHKHVLDSIEEIKKRGSRKIGRPVYRKSIPTSTK
ncbi:hypothetical protein E6V34_08560 [Clostridium perfringens]